MTRPCPSEVVMDAGDMKPILLVGISKGFRPIKLSTKNLNFKGQPDKPGLPGKWPLKRDGVFVN